MIVERQGRTQMQDNNNRAGMLTWATGWHAGSRLLLLLDQTFPKEVGA